MQEINVGPLDLPIQLPATSSLSSPQISQQTMKISIVTVSFNQRAYLREALDSVLLQEYPELEYIVVDPGSTDGSRELIHSYGDRISKAIFEPDHGAAERERPDPPVFRWPCHGQRTGRCCAGGPAE